MNQTNGSILIVDDKVSNLKVLLTFLQDHAYTVRIAESGERALQVLAEYYPDIILLDITMPNMNGFDLCKEIHANKKTADIPIIFMSALNAVEDKIKGFGAGGVDYITKPFQDVEVLARIKIHITLRQQKQELEKAHEDLLLQKKKLEILSITDDLTGLNNRRCLDLIFEREFKRGKRHGSDLTCLALDLDYFKRINDTYGHEAGDRVLQEFSTILMESIRSTDFVFRVGGEEFIILLTETSVTGALQAAEKIRLRVAEEHFTGIELPITVSIGISSIKQQQPGEANELMNLADKALYAAKENGRNRTTIYNTTT